MKKVTDKEWRKSGMDFDWFITRKAYPDNYKETFYIRMKEPVEIDEKIFMYFLECLPPIYIKNGFQNSEPVYARTYHTFTQKEDRYFFHGHGPEGGKWVKENEK